MCRGKCIQMKLQQQQEQQWCKTTEEGKKSGSERSSGPGPCEAFAQQWMPRGGRKRPSVLVRQLHGVSVLPRVEAVDHRLPLDHLQLLPALLPQVLQLSAVLHRLRLFEALARPPPHIPVGGRCREWTGVSVGHGGQRLLSCAHRTAQRWRQARRQPVGPSRRQSACPTRPCQVSLGPPAAPAHSFTL